MFAKRLRSRSKKEDYVESCLAETPTDMAEDPGENAFGTGATPPFLLRPGREDVLAPATREEFEEIARKAGEFKDSLGIFSIPVASDKSLDDFGTSMLMEKYFSDLKMTSTKNMTDEQTAYFRNREDWLDGTSLITSMTYMPSMVAPFLRSVRSGNNLLLLDLTIAGSTGLISPESLLTRIHAQVLFMIILAQTINPNVLCTSRRHSGCSRDRRRPLLQRSGSAAHQFGHGPAEHVGNRFSVGPVRRKHQHRRQPPGRGRGVRAKPQSPPGIRCAHSPPCHGRHGKPELFLPRQIYSIIAYFIKSLRS